MLIQRAVLALFTMSDGVPTLFAGRLQQSRAFGRHARRAHIATGHGTLSCALAHGEPLMPRETRRYTVVQVGATRVDQAWR